MSKVYMLDVYQYLTEGEGEVIGEKAVDGDVDCQRIINRYIVHYKDQKCNEAATELRNLIKDYAIALRIEHKKWPESIPISLRSYVSMAQIGNYTEPPG